MEFPRLGSEESLFLFIYTRSLRESRHKGLPRVAWVVWAAGLQPPQPRAIQAARGAIPRGSGDTQASLATGFMATKAINLLPVVAARRTEAPLDGRSPRPATRLRARNGARPERPAACLWPRLRLNTFFPSPLHCLLPRPAPPRVLLNTAALPFLPRHSLSIMGAPRHR